MITCKTALKLKNAGFPFKHNRFCDHEKEEQCKWLVGLEELIEVCIEVTKEFKLEYLGGIWCAYSGLGTKVYRTREKTAKEAVANLWLALHTK